MNRVFVVTATVILAVLSCNFPDPFTQLTGINLLPDSVAGFQAVPDGSQPDTAGIGWHVRAHDPLQPEDSTVSAESFIRFVPDFMPDTNHALLEARNLLPNGDFETTDVGKLPAGWQMNSSDFIAEVQQDVFAMPGKSLRINAQDAADAVFFALRPHADHNEPGLTDQAPALAEYFVRMDLQPVELSALFAVEVNNRLNNLSGFASTNSLIDTVVPLAGQIVYRYPFDFFGSEIEDVVVNSIFSLDSDAWEIPSLQIPVGIQPDQQSPSNVTVDNVRVGRTDVQPYIEYLLPLYPLGSDGPQLTTGGSFTFSFQYKQDSSIDDTGDGDNRFHSRGFMVEAAPYGQTTASGIDVDFALAADEGQTPRPPQDWTTFSLTVPGIPVSVIQDANSPESPVLALRIYTINNTHDQYSLDIGGFLLRDARLIWEP